MSLLIDHYAKSYPLWLAPDQVRVITLNDEDKVLINYAKPIVDVVAADVNPRKPLATQC